MKRVWKWNWKLSLFSFWISWSFESWKLVDLRFSQSFKARAVLRDLSLKMSQSQGEMDTVGSVTLALIKTYTIFGIPNRFQAKVYQSFSSNIGTGKPNLFKILPVSNMKGVTRTSKSSDDRELDFLKILSFLCYANLVCHLMQIKQPQKISRFQNVCLSPEVLPY